ncbi:hypothetical protein [Enterobacter cloacae]|uniref:hypothetical protein n=1 Tax=Enterobacter cloacae TaxID=550 RepID=UPI0031746B5E
MSSKKLIVSAFALALLMSQAVSAQTFREICQGNGEFYDNVKITSVITMTGDSSGNPKKVYIYTDKGGSTNVFASKDLRNADRADILMASNAQLAYLTSNNVELCVTGSGALYGIRLK